MTVLSTSKNAAAVRSGGTLGRVGPAVSAAAAALAVVAVPRPEYPPAADALHLARRVLSSLTELTPDVIAAL